jgi:hypothetical protein
LDVGIDDTFASVGAKKRTARDSLGPMSGSPVEAHGEPTWSPSKRQGKRLPQPLFPAKRKRPGGADTRMLRARNWSFTAMTGVRASRFVASHRQTYCDGCCKLDLRQLQSPPQLVKLGSKKMRFIVIFCKRRRKAVTPLLLAFWLFAIFVSVAHACGLEDGVAHAAQSEAANVVGHDRPDHSLPGCAKFCSDDLPVLAKLKAAQDPPAEQALMGSPFVGESFQTTVIPIPSLLRWSDPSPGIAVNIRFVRLAL